ncbi:MocR-like pyridoxine biosynthesis transcription factor PdxR [Konateibacter massiliensis]|uniref:MocR-like pyridoxine biosynthesis transcription factor PdxR n=1 Tax=Konateibacter massiliensis TaxID=2002841 RepID=UPI000C15A463|nr:PLP-dependent aminotransferase family protein [Konateibacter massiliensis]
MYELMIELNGKGQKPLYEQIYDYIKTEIQTGALPFNAKLPSTRLLAKNLQISRSTVDLAYEQLVSEGYIQSVPCKGYFVCQIEGLYQISNKKDTDDYAMPEKSASEFDFSPNGIDLENFPYNTWRKITKNALLEDNRELFQLGFPLGEPNLRETISTYLHQARGVNCLASQVILGAGNDYLLMILSQILGKNHVIAMENPTYKQAYKTFLNLNYKVNSIAVDKDGMSVKELEQSDSNIAYVMPSHQFPLGIVMPIKRRMELLNWALKEEKRYIIEDDYDSEFRYKGKPIPCLQGYDPNDKVIYIGTFSKSIAPAIRVSYMVLPKALMQSYYEKGFYASTVSRIDQTIVDHFINEGYYERHLNKMRAIYKVKHDILLNELKTMKNIVGISGENAGVHILVHFPKKIKEETLIEKAKAQGVKVYGLSDYYISDGKIGNTALFEDVTTIILGYASITEEEIEEAVRRVKEAWKEV